MRIHEYLLRNNHLINRYFPSDDHKSWINDFSKRNIPHDEPWLTLISTYSLFGDQYSFSSNQIKAFNDLLKTSGIANIKPIHSIERIKIEVKLPEVIEYRNYLKELAKKETIHFYPDRIESIKNKLEKSNSSIEGSTNLDLLIEAKRNDDLVIFFIESKFLSDIDTKITYNPVRDQIARNIDCGIDYCKKKGIDLTNFHFLLLTPKTFRTENYGGNRRDLSNTFNPDRSKFYCYKMNDYKEPSLLSEALPHRDDINMETISRNSGWLTFEDIYAKAFDFTTMKEDEREMIKQFFEERNLIEN